MSPVDISYFARGNISGSFKKEISEVLNDCYQHFSQRVPYKIEVYAFDSEENLNSFLREEKFKLGMSFNTVDDASACTYEVLRGYPRLLICNERTVQIQQAGQGRRDPARGCAYGSAWCA